MEFIADICRMDLTLSRKKIDARWIEIQRQIKYLESSGIKIKTTENAQTPRLR